MNKKITKDIRDILEDIRDGKLDHNQEYYHCGTAHCVAVWKVVRDMLKKDKTLDSPLIPTDKIEDFLIGETSRDEWEYAQREWGLTIMESIRLFSVGSELEEQFSVLKDLEADR